MISMNEWKEKLFYMARAQIAQMEPSDARELLETIEALERSREIWRNIATAFAARLETQDGLDNFGSVDSALSEERGDGIQRREGNAEIRADEPIFGD